MDGGAAVDNDYNSYLSGTQSPTETNGQIDTFDPFVNRAGGNYYLANGTSVNTGASLGAPYSTDMLGITRGTDGKWDRGAFEFNAGDLVAPSPPQGLRVNP